MHYNKFDFHWLDYFVISLFFVTLVHLTIRYSKNKLPLSEYLLAGRRLTLPVFVLTMFSTWYGGILGVGEFGYKYGISSWILQGVPYYFFAILFAFIFAAKARKMEVASISEHILQVYGPYASRTSALFTMILSSPAPYILMIAVLVKLMIGMSLLSALIISTIFSIGYLFRGGFVADRNTDIIFSILMFFGFMMFVVFLFAKYGSLSTLMINVPKSHLTWHGGNEPQFIVMWFLIALWTWVDPSFYQRCYAAKDANVARKGILWSVLFWFLFDCMTMICALYAKAVLLVLPDPMLAYPVLAEMTFPPFFKGLFFVCLLATILSTLNSQFFVSAIAVGRDFFHSLFPNRISEDRSIQISLLLIGVLSIFMALWIPSVIKLWYTIGTIIIPGLLLPMVTSFFPKSQTSPQWMLASMLLGFGVSFVCLCIGWSGGLGIYDAFPLGIEPIFPGLAVSIFVWMMGLLAKKA